MKVLRDKILYFQVTQKFFVGYIVGMSYVGISLIVFTTSFVVHPDLEKPNTILIHTLPFTNMMIALAVLAVKVEWFGETVAWKGIDLFRGFSIINRVMIGLQFFTTIVKLIHHINCLAVLEDGLWWEPGKSKTTSHFLKFFDSIFMISVIAWPLFQSAYLSHKREKTHRVDIVVMDNRKGIEKQQEE